MARDLVDVFALSQQLSKQKLLGLATEIDTAFNGAVFVEMLDSIDCYADVDVQRGDVPIDAVRSFVRPWV